MSDEMAEMRTSDPEVAKMIEEAWGGMVNVILDPEVPKDRVYFLNPSAMYHQLMENITEEE